MFAGRQGKVTKRQAIADREPGWEKVIAEVRHWVIKALFFDSSANNHVKILGN